MASATVQNVSDTALWVAYYRARESERPDALYQDPLAAKLAGDRGREIARDMPYGKMTAWIMAIRTVAIDHLIEEALAKGVDTVINLGAGLDTRPYRLKLPESLSWIEVDFPALIAMKNERLVGETPTCKLRRIALDLSQRTAAQALYAELGRQTSAALIITEGVIPYLSPEQAGDLADDLRNIPTFKLWIQDFRSSRIRWNPRKLMRKLSNAPFRFQHPEPLRFFEEHGWKVLHKVSAIDEGQRLGRPFPIPFPWSLFVRFIPPEKQREHRESVGYVLFETTAR